MRAIGDALGAAGLAMHDLHYRLSDVGGEQYGFKEASLALSRTLRQRREEFEISHPADSSARSRLALPCLLGVAVAAAEKGYAPGPRLICHLGNDDERRAALVVQAEVRCG